MGVLERTYRRAAAKPVDELLFSADSHVIEPEGLWKRELPPSLRPRAPEFGGRRGGDHPGAMDRSERVKEMSADGVSGEVLFLHTDCGSLVWKTSSWKRPASVFTTTGSSTTARRTRAG